MGKLSLHQGTLQLLVQRKEIHQQLLEFFSKRNIPNTCLILMIEQRKLEEKRLRTIKLSSKKEEHGNRCIMVVRLLTQSRKHMEQTSNSQKRRNQENLNLRSSILNLSSPPIQSKKVKPALKQYRNSPTGTPRSSSNRRKSSLQLKTTKVNLSQPIMD